MVLMYVCMYAGSDFDGISDLPHMFARRRRASESIRLAIFANIWSERGRPHPVYAVRSSLSSSSLGLAAIYPC